MKRSFLLRTCIALASLGIGLMAHAQLGVSPGPAPATPNSKAVLDLNDVTRGFLAPRMLSAQRPPAPGAGGNSLLVYQTDSNSVSGEPKGFYYWDNTLSIANKWVHVAFGGGWKLGGNSGTNPAVNFVGTTNAQPLVFRANGVNRAQLTTTGQLQIGTTGAATEKLEVAGAVRLVGTSATNAEGVIRYNATTGAHDGYGKAPGAAATWYQLENAFKTRVKQRYPSVPMASCAYITPEVTPAGGTAGSWPLIDGSGTNTTMSGTLETPYSTFWEDGRHQYLYQSADLQALNVCPGTDITGIAFQTAGGGTFAISNAKVSMKNSTQSGLTDFEYTGLQLCATLATFTPVNGWNAHNFNTSNWQWTGPGFNMLVEFCFDNQNWTSNVTVNGELTTYNAMYGLYCDACGSPSGGATCYYSGACGTPTFAAAGGGNYSLNPPAGTSSTSSGNLCNGWGWGGLGGGGCAWTSSTSLQTCDGTFQYLGAQTATARRPLLKFRAQVNAVNTTYPNGSYLYSQDGIMVGDYTTWANSALYSSPNYKFKGPGTITAKSSVWGGSVLLSDHVFDQYYDGRVKPEDARQALGYKHYTVKEMEDFVQSERHLPTIDGRDQWSSSGEFSIDHLTNQLWVTVEEQSLYIKELNDRMDALQQFLVQKRLKELKKTKQ